MGFRMGIYPIFVWRGTTKQIRISKNNRVLNSVLCALGLCPNYAQMPHRDRH